ncbi:MAG: 6-phosphogluconate dehydrogenase [Solirubrobacteraceae bacterium]|nr:6-phosphogluconate dehydrogenase [Solirubrobacteraceae bacterium]
MGANLARNIARHGYSIAVHNRTPAKMQAFVEEFGDEGAITGAQTLADLAAALEQPRKVIIMVKAGGPVDAVIDELVEHLDEGDIVIDAGNSNFVDTRRRTQALAERGLRFLGTGVSGGEEGALNGPSIMPGGDPDAYAEVEGILTSIAVDVDDTPCCTYVGPDGAGHYVKMVHNGIEYADMQLIAESYDLLRHGAGLTVPEIAGVFGAWNAGDLESFLIEITQTVLSKTDESGQPLVDVILDQAEQKGTGRWTSQDALELGVPLTAITEAVFARSLSALRDQRVRAAGILAGPQPGSDGQADPALVDDIRSALYASKVVAYAQGFEQMANASRQHGWDLKLGDMAMIWRGGCIIRARFLNRIMEAYESGEEVVNLLVVPYFADAMAEAQDAWRRVVVRAVELGIPVPAFSSCLAYYDGYRRARGPACLIQGQRDFFGAHTYRRTDRDGYFHTRWSQDGREVAV